MVVQITSLEHSVKLKHFFLKYFPTDKCKHAIKRPLWLCGLLTDHQHHIAEIKHWAQLFKASLA